MIAGQLLVQSWFTFVEPSDQIPLGLSNVLATYLLEAMSTIQFMLFSVSTVLLATERHGRYIALLMMDLEHFKLVNDRVGQQAGNRAETA